MHQCLYMQVSNLFVGLYVYIVWQYICSPVFYFHFLVIGTKRQFHTTFLTVRNCMDIECEDGH